MSTIETTSNAQFTSNYQPAYAATAADREALALSELSPVNLDIQEAVTTVLAAAPRMNELRAEMVAKLSAEFVEQLDKAEVYALALAYANRLYNAESTVHEVLPELAERALKARDLLLTDARALAQRGIIDGKPLESLKGGPGYMNIALDVGTLVTMLRERWTVIAGKTALTTSEIDQADQIYEQIMAAWAARKSQADRVTAAANERQRAFTLLVRTYDQVRRAATFLRWNTEDAEKFAPSLWTGRGSRTDLAAKSAAEAGAKTDTPSPASPPVVEAVPPPAPTVSAGHPGSSPFAEN